MAKKRKPRTYTMLSAGLPANPLPAVGLALASAVSFGDWSKLSNSSLLTVTEVSGTMWGQSPVLTKELLSGVSPVRV